MVKYLIGKYVRNWMECFTALSGKLPGGPEKTRESCHNSWPPGRGNK
jgi:hypothetical protein